ncbi:MAG TPA: YggT family protein [Thermoleophilaceae bacterium]
MTLVLAVTRDDIASYVGTLIIVYIVLIFIRILMSWLPRIPYNRWLDMFLTFVREVTDPFLNVFRRILPPIRIGPGAIDLSPTIAIFVLFIIERIVVSAIAG